MIDLFCGAGGFSEGFKQAGFKIVWALDKDFLASHTYRLNHDVYVAEKDIMEILTIPDCDIIIGSPPCPHFSNANRNYHDKPDIQYIDKFIDIIEEYNPKYWVMENVVGVEEFIPIKYKFKIQILQANWFGLYHLRKRVFCGNFPKVKKQTDNEIVYPTPIACDDHIHKSTNNPNVSCLSDYMGFTPEIDVFKRIMGFPDNYVFVGEKKEQIRQVGNAVCPPVARAIAEAILKKEGVDK